MRDLWQRLETYLKKHAPAALDFLNPPATESEIREAERELGVRFPADFAASLRVHNGQAQDTGNPPHPVACVPQEYEQRGIYRATWAGLAPLSLVVSNTLLVQEIIDEDWGYAASDFEYDGPVRRDGNWSWIVFADPGSGDQLGLDLNPDKGGTVGQVISIIHDPSCLLVLAPSYREWFQTLVERYESGRYFFVLEEGELDARDRFNPRANEIYQPPDKTGDDNILRFPG